MITAQLFSWERTGRVLFFLIAAAWVFWGAFIRNEIYYPFGGKRAPLREGRIVAGFLIVCFLMLAYLAFYH